MFFCLKERRFSIWLNQHRGGFTTTNQTIEERFVVDQPEQVTQAVTKRISSPDLGGHLYNLWINGSLKNIPPKTRSHREDLLFFVVCELFFTSGCPPTPNKKKQTMVSCISVSRVCPKIVRYRFENAAFWTTNLNSWGHRFGRSAPHVPWCPMLF